MDEILPDKAAQALEWPRLLELLATDAQSTMGAARCRSLPLASELAVARVRQLETTEMVRLLEGSEPVPALSFPDIRDSLIRASKGGVLEAQELRDCAIGLAMMEDVERYITRHHAEAQGLAQVVAPLHFSSGNCGRSNWRSMLRFKRMGPLGNRPRLNCDASPTTHMG